jgi:hypothetical protein
MTKGYQWVDQKKKEKAVTTRPKERIKE